MRVWEGDWLDGHTDFKRVCPSPCVMCMWVWASMHHGAHREIRGQPQMLALTCHCLKQGLYFVSHCDHKTNWLMTCWVFTYLHPLSPIGFEGLQIWTWLCLTLCRFQGLELMSPCLSGKHFTHFSISSALYRVYNSGDRQIDPWHPWSWMMIISMLSVNFGKTKQFPWAYPAGENRQHE